jgi:hypothetical protein
MFNEDSGLVKIWVDLVRSGKYSIEQVPNLSNLKQVVQSIINKE